MKFISYIFMLVAACISSLIKTKRTLRDETSS